MVHPGVCSPQSIHRSDIFCGCRWRTIAWPVKPHRARRTHSATPMVSAEMRDRTELRNPGAGAQVEGMCSKSAANTTSAPSVEADCLSNAPADIRVIGRHNPQWLTSTISRCGRAVEPLPGRAALQRSQCLGLRLRRTLQVPQEPIAKVVDPAVDRDTLLPPPCILHDRRLAHVMDLCDHVVLA